MEPLAQELKQEADEIDLLLLGAAESGKYFLLFINLIITNIIIINLIITNII